MIRRLLDVFPISRACRIPGDILGELLPVSGPFLAAVRIRRSAPGNKGALIF